MSLLAKRIPTVVAILVLILGIGGGIWMVQKQKPKINKDEIKPEKVRITNVSDTKFSVSWVTKKPVRAKLVYGKMGEKLTKVATDDRDLGDKSGEYLTHHITVAKLQPNTQYAFRIIEEDKIKFDNNGSPYGVKTGPTLSQTPTAETIYGVAKKDATSPAVGAIVYVDIPGATPLSAIVKKSGNWTIPISVARTLDLSSYVKYDPTATTFSITIKDGKKEAKAKAALKFAKPVPEMVLGKNYEFLAKAPTETQPTEASSSTQLAQKAETPKIFNIEPLSGETASDSGQQTTGEVTVTYPEEGEKVTTNQPEIKGTGSEGLVLSLELSSDLNEIDLSDTTTVNQDGTWSWVPNESLSDGSYNLIVSYVDEAGNEQEVKRSFEISLEGTELAFEASDSGEASSTTRVTMPATDSGVPVTGMWEQTVLTLLAGFGIMSLGGWLLKANEYDE